VEIRFPLSGEAGLVKVQVEFQPCDAKRCLAPEKVELSAPWNP